MKKASFLSGLLFLCSFTILAQSLPHSTPEAEGVSSEAIIKFIEGYSADKHELHS